MGCANFLQTPEQLLFTAAATNDLALAKHALHLHKVANIADKARLRRNCPLRPASTRASAPRAARAARHGPLHRRPSPLPSLLLRLTIRPSTWPYATRRSMS